MQHLRGSTSDRLRSMFAIHFAFEAQHTHLFLSHIAAAFDWTLPETAQPFGSNPRLRGLVLECLSEGVTRGDVDPTCDLAGVVDLLVAAYGWTYRLAASQHADAKAMTEVMDRRIGLIAQGFSAR
jgi:hypothetical protein